MNIYVHSAGFVEDYSRRQPDAAPPLPPIVRQWNEELDKSDTRLALIAGRTGGEWYIEFRNLVLPGIYDLRNRSIVLNICFGALTSEAQVRALALAYLDFELRQNGQRCEGRHCPELAAAYHEQNGDYGFDFATARRWAEQMIADFAATAPAATQAIPAPIYCCTDLCTDKGPERVREALRSSSLREMDGLRLLWAELCAERSAGADITLQYSTDGYIFVQDATPRHAKGNLERTRQLAADMQQQSGPRKSGALITRLIALLLIGLLLAAAFLLLGEPN